MRKRGLIVALCVVVAPIALHLPQVEVPVSAWQHAACDFLTGGGFIFPGTLLAGKGTFGVSGGCKHNAFWGHIEYQDHGMLVKVHGNTVTGYMIDKTVFPDPHARLICGTGTTPYGDVTWVVRAKDGGQACEKDEFDIQLQGTVFFYSTFANGPHELGGGNIQLHKPNYSNTGYFGGTCPPVIPGPPNPPTGNGADVGVMKTPDDPTVPSGNDAIFNIQVTAGGSQNSTAVMLTDTLPLRMVGFIDENGNILEPTPRWILSGNDASMCTLTQSDPSLPVNEALLTCNFGTMAPGDIRSITIRTGTNSSDDAIVNTAIVSTTAADTNAANNTSTATITTGPPE